MLLLLLLGQTSYPMLTHVHPVAVERGKESAVTVHGQMNLAGAYLALFEGDGLSASVVPDKRAAARAVQLKVKAGAALVPGVREFRLASNLGMSSVGQIVVSEHPVIEEKPGDNGTREKAQPIAVPCTVAGRIEAAEDVDVYRFAVKAGQRLAFEVRCARLQDKIHDLQKHADPILTLLDAEGRELAANDDFHFADPLLVHTFAKAGDYFIQIRDSKYDGDPRWVYALLVTGQPFATHAFPALRPGEKAEVEAVGIGKAVVAAPATPGIHEVVLETPKGKSNPVPLIVSALPQIAEAEPNDTPAKATRVALPCGINGRLEKPGDLDHFVFAAKKGAAMRFEVKARRFGTLLRSRLDSVLDILDAKGNVLATNDDANGKDAALAFAPPSDGDYVLRVRDLNGKGGPEWVYHIEAEPQRPGFSLKCDGDKAMVGPGSRMAWFVKLTRTGGFDGPVTVEAKGLPPGVTASECVIQPGQAQGLIVLSASPDAKVGASLVELVGKASVGTERVVPSQEIYSPGGGRALFDVSTFAVAVTDLSDILDVSVSSYEAVLKPGGEARLEVEIKRKPGHTKGVSVDVLLRHLGQVFGNTLPRGVTIDEGKSKTLLGAGSKGVIVLKAAADAPPVEKAAASVLANVSINFVVKVSYSSKPILVSVRR
ncbi:MAG: PPC domain-containing protein [Gemmataceae bacterium]|nr:PPC domain-containing protein [Gemmataceae bacterium]